MTSRRPLLVLLALFAGAAAAAAFLVRPAALPPAAAGDDAPPAPEEAASVAPDPWAVPDDLLRPALRYTRFETWTTADGLPSDRVTCVLADGDMLYVGTDRGVAVGRGGRFTTYGEAEGLAHRYVTSLALDRRRGDLWISTLRGVSRLSGGRITSWTQLDSGLMNDVVYHVAIEGDTLWAGTAAGLSGLDLGTGTWRLFDQTNAIMHEPWCYALAPAPGRLFVGLWGGALVELDHSTGLWREWRDPDGEMEIDLLADDGPIHEVTSFVAHESGVLWQATYFGVSRYDGRRWRSFTAADTGFPGDFVSHLSARGHTAWLGTDQGFAAFDGETCVSYKRTERGTCERRTTIAGRETERVELPTAPAHDYVLWTQGGDDHVWLATGAGLSRGTMETDAR